ncbi:lipid-A-disaccharide synthase [delta proteobacterium NaphS2]|nr:lipid-A-disaccharide synthase [delta proteobacterium NaphS2]
MSRKLILMVAGEASADLHGANLVHAMKRFCPEAVFCGIGGDLMAEAGVKCFVSAAELAVVGLTGIFQKFNTHLKAANALKSILKTHRPDLLILIDYPGFNLYMARVAKRLKIRVLYYISPQVWAWRQGRVKKIARRVDKMAVILPFEKPFFEKSGIDVEYVGHPLMDAFESRKIDIQTEGLKPQADPAETANAATSESADERPVLGLVPGSRREEILNLLPVMIKAGEILSREYPHIRFVLPLAGTISSRWLSRFLQDTPLDIEVCREGIYAALSRCHLAFVTSGTATLDAAIMTVPMVVVYKVKSFLTYEIGKRVIKVPYLGLVNLVAGESVAPELIQDDVTPEKLAMAGRKFLADDDLRRRTIGTLRRVKESLGRGGASERTARIAAGMMGCSG